MTWAVGLDSDFFGGVFGLLLFLANLLLNVNMLPTLDSDFFRENLLKKKLSPKVKKSSKM